MKDKLHLDRPHRTEICNGWDSNPRPLVQQLGPLTNKPTGKKYVSHRLNGPFQFNLRIKKSELSDPANEI